MAEKHAGGDGSHNSAATAVTASESESEESISGGDDEPSAPVDSALVERLQSAVAAATAELTMTTASLDAVDDATEADESLANDISINSSLSDAQNGLVSAGAKYGGKAAVASGDAAAARSGASAVTTRSAVEQMTKVAGKNGRQLPKAGTNASRCDRTVKGAAGAGADADAGGGAKSVHVGASDLDGAVVASNDKVGLSAHQSPTPLNQSALQAQSNPSKRVMKVEPANIGAQGLRSSQKRPPPLIKGASERAAAANARNATTRNGIAPHITSNQTGIEVGPGNSRSGDERNATVSSEVIRGGDDSPKVDEALSQSTAPLEVQRDAFDVSAMGKREADEADEADGACEATAPGSEPSVQSQRAVAGPAVVVAQATFVATVAEADLASDVAVRSSAALDTIRKLKLKKVGERVDE